MHTQRIQTHTSHRHNTTFTADGNIEFLSENGRMTMPVYLDKK